METDSKPVVDDAAAQLQQKRSIAIKAVIMVLTYWQKALLEIVALFYRSLIFFATAEGLYQFLGIGFDHICHFRQPKDLRKF